MTLFEVGDRIGDFELITRIARGGDGEVWRAQRIGDEAPPVALKLFDRPDDAASEAALLKQASVVAGIIEIVDSGDGWLALPWIEGRTLAHVLQTEGPLSPERTVRLLRQIAATLDEIHELAIVHGDLSPSNVLVDLHDQITIIDPVGTVPGDCDGATARFEIRTTPRYASPEVAGGSVARPASDQYALAMIGFEAMTGESPFPPVEVPMAMLGQHVSTPPVAMSEVAPALGVRFDEAFERALAKEPQLRHANATAFVDALDHDVGRASTGAGLRPSKRFITAALLAVIAGLVIAAIALNRGDLDAADRAPQAGESEGVAGAETTAVVTPPADESDGAGGAETTAVVTPPADESDGAGGAETTAVVTPPADESDGAGGAETTAVVTPPADADGPDPVGVSAAAAARDPETSQEFAGFSVSAASTWTSGQASQISCNLVTSPGFEQDRLPQNWYGGDNPPLFTLVPGAGVEGSTALQVGAQGRYGLVGERVPVEAGQPVVFAAWIRRIDGPVATGMWVEFETIDYERIDAGDYPQFVAPDGSSAGPEAGQRVARIFEAPPNATWAIPSFYKDASSGALLVDEVVFGPADVCADVAS